MLTFQAADMAAIHAVFSDLSEVSAEEVIKDCGSWWKALPKVLKLLALPDSQTEALVDESGTALALFGHYPSETPRIRTTWFVFSNGFIARKAMAVLACWKRVDELRLAYPETEFHSYTTSRHSQRARWFSLLGFHFVGLTSDGAQHYVLQESDKTSDLESVEQYNPTNPRAS